MKSSTLLLAASLLGNAVLVAVLATHLPPASRSATTFSNGRATQMPMAENGARSETKGATGVTREVSKTAAAAETFWSRLETDDLLELSRRLRAAGFPFRAVQRVVLDLARARAEIARTALQGKTADTPYWKVTQYFPDDPELRERVREVNSELNRLTRDMVFNPEALVDDEGLADGMRQTYGNLPLEKLQRLMKARLDYSEMRDVISRAIDAGPSRDRTPAEREKFQLLDAEEQRDLQQILTPEEYEGYQLRSSSTARTLRTQLDLFQPTEAEYKALFALRKPVDDQLSRPGGSDEDRLAARAAAMKALAPQIAAALGPERYADYVQVLDPAARRLNWLVTDLALPLSTVGKVEAVRADISQRAEAARVAADLAPAEKTARLSALAQEARAKISTTLGPRGFAAYEEIKGDWIGALGKDVPAKPTP